MIKLPLQPLGIDIPIVEGNGCFYNVNSQRIFLNEQEIQTLAEKANADWTECLYAVLLHEYGHHILYKNKGLKAALNERAAWEQGETHFKKMYPQSKMFEGFYQVKKVALKSHRDYAWMEMRNQCFAAPLIEIASMAVILGAGAVYVVVNNPQPEHQQPLLIQKIQDSLK